jgi:hypothetical protein
VKEPSLRSRRRVSLGRGGTSAGGGDPTHGRSPNDHQPGYWCGLWHGGARQVCPGHPDRVRPEGSGLGAGYRRSGSTSRATFLLVERQPSGRLRSTGPVGRQLRFARHDDVLHLAGQPRLHQDPLVRPGSWTGRVPPGQNFWWIRRRSNRRRHRGGPWGIAIGTTFGLPASMLLVCEHTNGWSYVYWVGTVPPYGGMVCNPFG